jgi:hypothetical protein
MKKGKFQWHAYDGGKATHFSFYSEKGKTAKLVSPWAEQGLRCRRTHLLQSLVNGRQRRVCDTLLVVC